MIRYQRPKVLSKNNNFVNVRFHPGAATEGFVDFIKPVIRKKPDAVIIHAGTKNDQSVKQRKPFKKCDSGKVGIGFSGIIERADRNFSDQIKETNDNLKRYCEGIVASFMWIMIILMRKV